jgi:hypothetical protein
MELGLYTDSADKLSRTEAFDLAARIGRAHPPARADQPSYTRPVISSPQARAAADDGSVNRASRALATRAA